MKTDAIRRRALLQGGIALATFSVAGCGQLVDGDGEDGPTTGDPDGDGGAGDGDDSGEEPGSGGPGDDGTGDGDADGDGGIETVGIGQSVAGEYAALTVEYVRPLAELRDYSEFPDVGAETAYGEPRTAEYYRQQGFLGEDVSFHGVGIAVTNTADRIVNARTVMFRSEDDSSTMLLGGRSQRLTFAQPYLLPGETMRAEYAAALRNDPSTYTMTMIPMETGTGRTEQLHVDLSRGSEGQASYGQSPPVDARNEPVRLGDFDVTVHATAFVDRVEETHRPEKFGARDGFRYLVVDLSASRSTDEVVPGVAWRVGVRDEDGHGFAWPMSGVAMYHDVAVPNRTRVDQLAVDETLDHTRLAFAIEYGFEPEYLTMNAPGPLADPPEVGSSVGVSRAVWAIE